MFNCPIIGFFNFFIRRHLKSWLLSLVAFRSLVFDIYTSWDCAGVEGTSLLLAPFSLCPHFCFKIKLTKFSPVLSDPFLFRYSRLLLKSALRLIFLYIIKSNLASLLICKSSSLTSNALLLKLSLRRTIDDILTVRVFVLTLFATS